LALTGCPNSSPNLPGEFLGSFIFTGQMVSGGDGGTTCLVDGGALSFPASVQFYAQLSLSDGGAVMWWQLENALPVEGAVQGSTFSETTQTVALVSACNCAASLQETVTLTSDAGLVLGLPLLFGVVDDRLDPTPELQSGPVCGSVDAGVPVDAGCGLACDLIYEVSGVPSQPSGGYPTPSDAG
jgi:hypothetical protein